MRGRAPLLFCLLCSLLAPPRARAQSASAAPSPCVGGPRYSVSTFAFSGAAGSLDGVGTAATVQGPAFLALDEGRAALYLSVQSGCRVRVINTTTRAVTTLMGSGAQVFPNCVNADGVGTVATLDKGAGALALDVSAQILYTGTLGIRVKRTVLATRTTTTLAGGAVASTLNAVGTNAGFCQPRGLALDAAGGWLYVADPSCCVIRGVALATATVTTLAGTGGTCVYLDAPVALNAAFATPQGMRWDAVASALYVTEAARLRAVAFSSPGVAGASRRRDGVSRLAGSERLDSSDDGVVITVKVRAGARAD
jgi:DNA-binding beta-propeller fold protein YncE